MENSNFHLKSTIIDTTIIVIHQGYIVAMTIVITFLLVFLLTPQLLVESFSSFHGRRSCIFLIRAGKQPFPLSEDPVFRKEWNEGRDQNFIPIGPLEGTEIDHPLSLRDESEVKERQQSPNADRYFKALDSIAPHDLIAKFVQTAPKNVQEATKGIIVNLLGSLPAYTLDAALMTTNMKLASLLFQMQITGYMFKNAEYRMSLTQSLKGVPRLPSSGTEAPAEIMGTATYRNASGELVTVNVKDLAEALQHEVNELRKELATIKDTRESELKANLLTYIQALPEKELSNLTTDISADVMEAIKLLVETVMGKIGGDFHAPQGMVQQSVINLAQLCMWQMVIGYRLREMEALDHGLSLDDM